jgi:hypothetical protein
MSIASRIHAFLHPLAAVQLLQKSFDSERRLWTSKGHLLVSELTNKPQWEISKEGKAVTFIDEWLTKEGESVSRAVHVLDTSSLESATKAGDVA